MDDINCVSRALDWEKICLHPKDEISFRKWIDVLRLEGANTFCKDKIDRASLRSGLSEDAFCLVLQKVSGCCGLQTFKHADCYDSPFGPLGT